MPDRELAVIKDVGVGSRDVGKPVLWFTVEMLHGASLQVFDIESETAHKILGAVYDVSKLEGRPCEVETRGAAGSTVTFVGLK